MPNAMILPKTPLSAADVARHYDELDTFYRSVWGDHVHHGLWATGREPVDVAVRQLVDVVAAEAEIEPGHRVLDVGSGYGAPARQIAFDYGAEVTGITLSRAQHAYAERLRGSGSNPTFLLGDWLTNRLPDAAFDAVYAIESASHVGDRERFVAEAVRVLRPGGVFVLCAWTAAEAIPPWQARHLLEPICRNGRLAHLSTAPEYVDLLERSGAALVEFQDISRRVRRTWTVAIRRTLAHLLSDPAILRYLLNARSGQRAFLPTMFLMWAAYRVGALRYCLIKARRPASTRSPANLA